MNQLKIVILFLFICVLGFAQGKVKTELNDVEGEVQIKGDSIFVFESVRDTVYEIEIERPAPTPAQKKKFIHHTEKKKEEVTKPKEHWFGLRMRLLAQRASEIETVFNSSRVRDEVFSYEPIDKSLLMGIKTHLGKEENSFLKQYQIIDQTIVGAGFWTRKKLFRSSFSVGIGLDAFFYAHNNTYRGLGQGNNNKDYYTRGGKQLVFSDVKSNSYQIQAPLQIGFSPGRFVIMAGAYTSYCEYELGMFRVNSGAVDFSSIDYFTAEVIQFGYTAEVQYHLFTHLSLGIMASHGGFENLAFINDNNESFSSVDEFKETKGMIQLVYTF